MIKWYIQGKYHYLKNPWIMGILNTTPDSFSDGGKYTSLQSAISHACQMIDNGANIIDVGGESTRPGASFVDVKEEIDRVVPVIREIRKKSNILISIDTSKATVALEALRAGANIINDVTAFQDAKMLHVAQQFNAGIVLMHMRGTPKTMQSNIQYDDFITTILNFLKERIAYCSENNINTHAIALDPGIGFGKSVDQNIQLLKSLSTFNSIGHPILVGTSRKSFIGHILSQPVDHRLIGSLTSALISIQNGAHIVRVHDVIETKHMLQFYSYYTGIRTP